MLDPPIVEEIIERAVKFYRADVSFDNTLLFEMLIKVRKCASIFELLEQERVKVEDGERTLMQ